MDIFAKNIKEALSQADDSELQLKLQAAQHAHELKMMTMFTKFLAGRQPYQPHPHPGHATGQAITQIRLTHLGFSLFERKTRYTSKDSEKTNETKRKLIPHTHTHISVLTSICGP